MIGLLKLGFLPIRIWDVLDVLIVGYLIYLVFNLLRGSIGFKIFVGVLTLFLVWWLVGVY
jgi:diadenylate cyclase